jgi:hypothetical protein
VEALVKSGVVSGIRDNCLYEVRTDKATDKRADATILLLSLESGDGFLKVVDARTSRAGRADEYQQRCFEEWFTGRTLSVEGMRPGERYRVTFPLAF